MTPDLKQHQKWLASMMNLTNAKLGLPTRMKPDGTIYYEYSQLPKEEIFKHIVFPMSSPEQRQAATDALKAQLENTTLDETEVKGLQGRINSSQAFWIGQGAGLLSQIEERNEARDVLSKLHEINELLPSDQEDVVSTFPHRELVKKLEEHWIRVSDNLLGLSSEDDENARDALQFLSEVKGENSQ